MITSDPRHPIILLTVSKHQFFNPAFLYDIIFVESLPTVLQFDHFNATRIFSGNVPYVMYLFTDANVDNSQVLEAFEHSAYENRNLDLFYERALHVTYAINETDTPLTTFFELYDRSQLPVVFLTRLTADSLLKYKYPADTITFDGLRQFLQDARSSKIINHMNSEEVPKDDKNHTVRKLVGLNFRDEVVRSQGNWIVIFCDGMNNGNCPFTFKQFEYIAKKLENIVLQSTGKDGEIILEKALNFGYFDIEKNEIPFYKVTGSPEIALWMKGSKLKPETFQLPHTPRNLAAWINSCLIELNGLTLTEEEEKAFIKANYNEADQRKFETMFELNRQHAEKLRLFELEEQQKKAKEDPILSLGPPVYVPPPPTIQIEVEAEKVKKNIEL